MKIIRVKKVISFFVALSLTFLQCVSASFAGGPTDLNQPVTNDFNPGVSATGTLPSPSTPVVNQSPTTIDSLMGDTPISPTTSDIQPRGELPILQPRGGFPAPQLPVLTPGLPVYIPPMVDEPQEFELAKTSVASLSFGTSALVIERTKPSYGEPYTFEAVVMEGITANGNTVVSRTPLTPGSIEMPHVTVNGQTLAVGVSPEGEGLICVPVAAGQVAGADGRQHGKLTFASIPKATYAIQTSTDMRTWTTVTTLLTTTSWTDPAPASGFKFYRVVVTGVDIVPPSIAVFETFPHVTNNPDLTVSYIVDGGAVQTKSFTLSATNCGVNNLSIAAVDAAGNENTAYFTVILDTNAPVVVTTSPIPALTKDGLLTVNYTVDGAVQVPIQVTLKEGDNTVVIPAQQDEAGNVTPAQTFHVMLDTQPPAGTIVINNSNVTTLSPFVTLTLEASDATAGLDQMRFSVNAGQTWSDWENFASSKALSLPSGDGTKGILCQVKDRVGNSASFSNSIILDSTPQTNQDVRKTLILGSLTDPAGHPLTYSFTAAPVLSQNGQFVLLGNQLTYIPSKNFTGSGVVTVSVSGGSAPVQYPVTLSVVAPVIHTPNDPLLSAQWYLNTIDALRAWNLSQGAGVSVAVFDTGIMMSHEDLAGNIFTNSGETGIDANGKDKATNGIDDDGNGYIDDIHGWNYDTSKYNSSAPNNPLAGC